MKRVAQWSLYIIIWVFAIAAFLLLAADEAPDKPMSNLAFLSIKASATGVLYACYIAGKYFERRGMLPKSKNHENEEDWEN